MRNNNTKSKENILLVIDLQREFADKEGHYERILQFVNDAVKNKSYTKVIATKCLNKENSNFVRYSNWDDLIGGSSPLEFEPDEIIEKISYGLTDYSFLPKSSSIDVIGYNTGACVLKAALDLFDRDYDFSVLSQYCYSSNGAEHHEKGMWTLKNLMENAIK